VNHSNTINMLILGTAEYLGSSVECYKRDGLHISLIKYREEDDLIQSEELHMHQNPHLSYFIEGGNIEQRKGVGLERLAGDIAFYEAGEAHSNKGVKFPSTNINIEFESSFLNSLGLSVNEISKTINTQFHAKFIILRLYSEFAMNEKEAYDSIYALATLLVAGFPGKRSKAIPNWVNKVKQMLNDRWNDHPSLEYLSTEAGVHPVTISKYFPIYFNSTYGEYMRRLKVERALQLIKNTDDTLTDIAFSCGFADPSHFSRTFKGITNLLPGSFREL
jgi:AraC family transcriptional regulator